jgi:hypothetical protein
MSGAFVIEPRFEWVSSFKDGLAAAREGGKSGYIDRVGTFVVPPTFDGAAPVQLGLGQVWRGGDVFYVDLRRYTSAS